MHRNTRATGLLRASATRQSTPPSARLLADGIKTVWLPFFPLWNTRDRPYFRSSAPGMISYNNVSCRFWPNRYSFRRCAVSSGTRIQIYYNKIIYTLIVILIIDIIIWLNDYRANHQCSKTEVVGIFSSKWLSDRCAVCGSASCECYILIYRKSDYAIENDYFLKLFKLNKFLITVFTKRVAFSNQFSSRYGLIVWRRWQYK